MVPLEMANAEDELRPSVGESSVRVAGREGKGDVRFGPEMTRSISFA